MVDKIKNFFTPNKNKSEENKTNMVEGTKASGIAPQKQV